MGEFRVMTWNVQNLFEVGHRVWARYAGRVRRQTCLAGELSSTTLNLTCCACRRSARTAPSPRCRTRSATECSTARSGFQTIEVFVSGSCPLSSCNDLVDIRPFPAGLLPIQVGDDPDGPDGPRLMNQMGRGALQCTVRANDRDVRVISCHLKSKLLTFPGGRFNARDEDERARFSAYALFRRASEATTLRTHLTAELAGAGRNEAVILAGDMNDELAAATTLILNGPPGSEIGTLGFERADNGDGDRMWNLAPLIPESERFSRVYRGRPELIDHIFASRFLVEESNRRVGGHGHGSRPRRPAIDGR